MRVVVTCDFFLKYAIAQSAALARTGADVLLLCRDHPLEFAGDARERECALTRAREAGVMIVEIPGRYWDLAAAPELKAIRKRVARFAADILHAHQGADPRALVLVPEVPTVLTVHDPKPHPGHPVARFAPKRWFLTKAAGAWLARASAIVVHSERLLKRIQLRAQRRCFVLPHGLDVRAEPLPLPSKLTVGFFGRLEPYKGLDVLATAMPHVWARRPGTSLRIAGSGPSTFPLADSRVQIERAYVPEAKIADFFTATSLLVLPYTEASQTGAGSLAVGYGVPVVASRVGGLPELTLDETYLADPGDDVSLASAIVRHIHDDGRVRARVLSEVATPRSWDAVSQESIAIYEELVSRDHQ